MSANISSTIILSCLLLLHFQVLESHKSSNATEQDKSEGVLFEACTKEMRIVDMDPETVLTFFECASRMVQARKGSQHSDQGFEESSRFDGHGVLGSEVVEMSVDELIRLLGLPPDMAKSVSDFARCPNQTKFPSPDPAEYHSSDQDQRAGLSCEGGGGLFWSPAEQGGSERFRAHYQVRMYIRQNARRLTQTLVDAKKYARTHNHALTHRQT